MPTLHTLIVFLALACLGCSLAAAQVLGGSSADQSSARVEYTVDIEHPATQTCEITMTVRGWKGDTLDVHLPVWRPGRYEVLDPAGTIRSIAATDGRGRPLPLQKVAKSSWTVTTGGSAIIRVKYTLYANAVNNRTRHIDDTHAFLSGSTVFLFVHELRANPIEVAINAPQGWKTATGLEASATVPNVFLAPDYDTLVDSPFEIGIHRVLAYEVDGIPHEIAIWGEIPEGTVVSDDQLLADFAAITRTQREIFGRFPYKRYVFLTHIGPGMGGGTEHLNSTIIQTKPENFTDKSRYHNFLGLVSHELFHTWNVKQFRPAGLKPYDYQRENYTTLLWVAEGTTSYYDELLCLRAGVFETKHYLESLGKTIDAELARPGRSLQSLEESSFDAWIKFNRATPDAVNSTVSFYSKGALVSLMLDARIRTLTSGAGSLDDVMRTLSGRFPHTAPGYTTADVLDAIRYVTGEDFTPFFNDFVRGTADLPINDALAVFGLETVREGEGDEQRAYLGLDLRDADGLATVSVVRDDGPGPAAGINVDDQIVALNGQRLRAGELESRLKQLKPGQIVTLHVIRRDLLREVRLSLASRPKSELKVQKKKDATPEQKAAFESWTGQRWGG